VRTASVNQVRKPVYRSATGRWRAHASHLGPLLDALAIAPEPSNSKTASLRKSRGRAQKSAE